MAAAGKLNLKFRQYPEKQTNRMLNHCNIIIIFDTVVTQKRNFKHEK